MFLCFFLYAKESKKNRQDIPPYPWRRHDEINNLCSINGHSRSFILTFQIKKVENLQIEYLRKATELCDSCEDPLNEVQNLYDRLTK